MFQTMRLTINGETRALDDLPAQPTVRDLLVCLGLGKAVVAVEVNRQVVPRQSHAQTALKDGDELELVTLVGGG